MRRKRASVGVGTAPTPSVGNHTTLAVGGCQTARVSVLPHSGHCVSSPGGGCSTVDHSSLPAGASNPQARQRCVVLTDMVTAVSPEHLTVADDPVRPRRHGDCEKRPPARLVRAL